MNSSFSARIKVISFFVVFLVVVIIVRLFLVQVVHGTEYSENADRQYTTPTSNIFERGVIYFKKKNGEFVGAGNTISGFKVAIVPKSIIDHESVYTALSSITKINYNSFIKSVNKKGDPYEEVANRISKEEADQITALSLPGVSIYKEKWRFYPGGNLASHAIGFVAYNGDDLLGRYGIERFYNDVLSWGSSNLYVNFFAEVFSNINMAIFKNKSKDGDIVSTIEPTVQSFLEKELQNIMGKYKAESAGGIIINPIDGSIYAMASSPSFNLNEFSKEKNPSMYANPIVERVFELGSTIKPLGMAAGIDAGVVTADTKYNDNGYVIVENKKILNFDKKGRGSNISMQEVLNQSLNTGMVFVMQKLGKEKFRDYMLGYGIENKTGIDIPNETPSLVANLHSPRTIEYATASFGQGIALTPIAAARAFSTLANGGYLIKPHLVDEIRYRDGGSKKIEMDYSSAPRVISKDTSLEITRMLVFLVDKALGGGAQKMEHYSIAAKTGTAQLAKEGGGGYYEDKHLHSFFGYFPAYDPKFLILLYTVNPRGASYASETVMPPFMETAKFLLNYYQVPPDR